MINAFNIKCYNSTFCKLNSDNPIQKFEISLPYKENAQDL